MMNKLTPVTPSIQQLAEFLLTKQSADKMSPIELAALIANDPTTYDDLANLSSALIGTPSTLHAEIQQLQAEEAALELLGAYVEAEMAGADAATRYPTVAAQIQQSPAVRAEYEALRLLLQEENQGALAEAPHTATFAEWYQEQVAPSPKNAAASAGTLWQQISATVQRLAIEIPLQLGQMRTAFGALTDQLIPQVEPALTYRSRPAGDADGVDFDQVLELPAPDANLVIRLRTGMVAHGRGMMVVELNELAAATPLPQSKVTLRDGDGGLLESTATDEQGRAIFRELIAGNYQIQVEHQGQKWEVPLTLQ